MARLHIPVPDKVLPWQVTVSAVALLIGAVNCTAVALSNISRMGDRAGIKAAIEEGDTLLGTTVAEGFDHYYISMTVFATLGLIYLVLGLLLWRGEHRHGVRMIGTIMAAVNVIGLTGMLVATGGSAFQQTSSLVVHLVVQIVILIGMIMLWEGGGRRWEHEGA